MLQEHKTNESINGLPANYPFRNSEDASLSHPTPAKLARKKNHHNDLPPSPEIEISPVDPIWQMIDPTPDIQTLFTTFDKQFFGGRLSAVEVRWSPRMTLCAGLCVYEGRGGLCSIRMSEPLLKYRPRSDTVETLLHEMIHAYLFVTENVRDRDGHGSNFKFHMNRINACAKTNITIYHNFHDEVNNYKVHWWKCNGPCASRPPFFGLVRRSMNRAPGPNDIWWSEHQASCSGQFIKIKEPEKSNKKPKNVTKVNQKRKQTKLVASSSTPDLRSYLLGSPKSQEAGGHSMQVEDLQPPSETDRLTSNRPEQAVVPFSGVGHVLGGLRPPQRSRLLALPITSQSSAAGCDRTASAASSKELAECPVCSQKQPILLMDAHLDECLAR
uniref:Protein with SprT-like domain at the N terminus n=1 Tax=Mesocestoides corti TaxID=53468 RepID=A0A5K3F0M3_MESCO